MDEEKTNQSEKTIEKRYVEVNASKWHRFLIGVISGLGQGIGFTVGTAAFLIIAGLVISKIDFVPIFGNFLADVIKSAQSSLISK